MWRQCNCGCGPLLVGVNTTEAALKARNYWCRASMSLRHRPYNDRARAKPENREKARQASKEWYSHPENSASKKIYNKAYKQKHLKD